MINTPADGVRVLPLLRIPVDKTKLGAVLLEPVDGGTRHVDDAACDLRIAQIVVVVHQLRKERVFGELAEHRGIVFVFVLLKRGFNGKETRGESACTADARPLFKHNDACAAFSRGQRSGRAGSAGPDHHDVCGHRFGLTGLLDDLHVVLLRIGTRLFNGGLDGSLDGAARHRCARNRIDGRALVFEHGRHHLSGGYVAEALRFTGNVDLDVGDFARGVERHGGLDGAELALRFAFKGTRCHGNGGCAAHECGKRRHTK